MTGDIAQQEEMLLHSSSSDEPQRPYKVFISLLDKWEIGYPLTDVLIEDALRALKSALDKGDEPDVSSPFVSPVSIFVWTNPRSLLIRS